jgi:hypothetical protein
LLILPFFKNVWQNFQYLSGYDGRIANHDSSAGMTNHVFRDTAGQKPLNSSLTSAPHDDPIGVHFFANFTMDV